MRYTAVQLLRREMASSILTASILSDKWDAIHASADSQMPMDFICFNSIPVSTVSKAAVRSRRTSITPFLRSSAGVAVQNVERSRTSKVSGSWQRLARRYGPTVCNVEQSRTSSHVCTCALNWRNLRWPINFDPVPECRD